MENKAIKDAALEKMKQAIEHLKKDFGTIRTGRASTGILEGISVDYYGTPTPLQQVSTVNTPDSRTITIQPWEQKLLGAIEKAILKSDLGVTPANDGVVIRIVIPPLNEERRRDLVKVVHKKGEDTKVTVRNVRRDANDAFKKLEKDGHVSKDEIKKALDEMQRLTDANIVKVDEVMAHKEKEIMEV